MDGSFRILEKTSSELICTRLYTHYGTSLTQLAFELWIKNLWFCVIFRIFLIFYLIKTEEYLAKNLLYWDSSDILIVWTNCFAQRSVLLYFKRKRHHENTFFRLLRFSQGSREDFEYKNNSCLLKPKTEFSFN